MFDITSYIAQNQTLLMQLCNVTTQALRTEMQRKADNWFVIGAISGAGLTAVIYELLKSEKIKKWMLS